MIKKTNRWPHLIIYSSWNSATLSKSNDLDCNFPTATSEISGIAWTMWKATKTSTATINTPAPTNTSTATLQHQIHQHHYTSIAAGSSSSLTAKTPATIYFLAVAFDTNHLNSLHYLNKLYQIHIAAITLRRK